MSSVKGLHFGCDRADRKSIARFRLILLSRIWLFLSFSNLSPMNAAAGINRAAAMLQAAPARRLSQIWLYMWGRILPGSFQNRCFQWIYFHYRKQSSKMNHPAKWEGSVRRWAGEGGGRGGGRNWDICLGVTQQSHFFFLRWWQTPRSRPFGHQGLRAVSSQTGSWNDFASARGCPFISKSKCEAQKMCFSVDIREMFCFRPLTRSAA